MVDWPVNWDYPRLLLVALVVVTAVTLVVVASTSTAAFGTYNPAWDGASDLRGVARDTGADATVTRDLEPYRQAEPAETVAVVLSPTDAYTPTEAAQLRAFVEAGGTLVVAEDFGPHTNPLLRQLGAQSRIDGTLIRDERRFFRSPAMPIVTNVTNHSLTADVEQLTVNHGTAVEPDGARVLARTSDFAYADANGNGALDANEALASYPVVTVESLGSGTLVVVGDPSLFINVMLEQPGNAIFVRNLFSAHGFVLLDYSHTGAIPPLSLAVLFLRGSPILQVGLGLGGLALIGAWASGRYERPPRGDRPEGPAAGPALSEDAILAYLERRYPDWDDDRVDRVVGGLIRNRSQSRRDE